MKDNFEIECQEQVKSIAQMIEHLAKGNDNEIEELREKLEDLEYNEPDESIDNYGKAFEDWKNEVNELEEKIEELEENDFYNYITDYLDVDYIVNSSKEYQSARIWITIGGPNICIDTEDGAIKLYWGSTRSTAYITASTRDRIDEIFEEIFTNS